MGRPKKTRELLPTYKIPVVAGFSDIITDLDPLWSAIFKRLFVTARIYGFHRAETPLLENAQLYEIFRESGKVRGGQLPVASEHGLTAMLRSRLLPGIVRSYTQQKLPETKLLSKWLYAGMVARHGQKKQLVQQYEYGLEVCGQFTHLVEAHTIAALWQFYTGLGLENVSLEINTIGSLSCQKSYQESLRDFAEQKKFDLCDECTEHSKTDPLEILRCMKLDCQTALSDAPTILDFLDEGSHKHFTLLLEALNELQIPYQLNPLYVGFPGAVKTVLAIRYKTKQTGILLSQGGYHDTWLSMLGVAVPTAAFGVWGDLYDVHKAMTQTGVTVQQESKIEIFLVPLGELAAKKSLRLFRDLTTSGLTVYDNFGDIGVKNQLKLAESYKAPIALIMGQKEAVDEMVILRDVKSGMQELFSYDKIVDEVKKRLGK